MFGRRITFISDPVKPTGPASEQQFPKVDCFFHSGMSNWRGYSSPDGEEGDFRTFHNLTREFLRESARERSRELVVFALVVAASAWPVIYMLITVVKLLIKGRPLSEPAL